MQLLMQVSFLHVRSIQKTKSYISGMISSAIIWGFLFDVLGRRKLLVLGFLLDAIFVFMSVLSQSLPLLIVSKYLQGFM